MTDAFVNIVVDAGAVSAAVDEIAALDGVDTVYVVTGEYDILAQLSLESQDELPKVVTEEIHAVTGVEDTVTNIAFGL